MVGKKIVEILGMELQQRYDISYDDAVKNYILETRWDTAKQYRRFVWRSLTCLKCQYFEICFIEFPSQMLFLK